VSAGRADALRTPLLRTPQVRVLADDKPAYIAIANAVGTAGGQLELLIKSVPGTAESICALAEGATLEVSDVQGKGFAALPAGVSSVLLFATGSGISPIRSLLETPVAQGGLAGSAARVQLYLGVRTPAHAAFSDRVAAWERAGVKVTPVYSGADKKYIQDVFSAAGVDGASTAAYVVGQKVMTEALIAALMAAGVPRERCLMNF
jgi:NAD(P)H-flavin reductase